MKKINYFDKYISSLIEQIKKIDKKKINDLKNLITKTGKKNKIFICGNGGSAANAEHVSNDLMLGINSKKKGLNIFCLNSNISKLTCIANDLSYEDIYSHQIDILGSRGDLLIVLSGSGNSRNIIKALKSAKKNGLNTFAILGFNGGKSKKISNNFLHFKINDMQISEDMQLIVFNLIMKSLIKK